MFRYFVSFDNGYLEFFIVASVNNSTEALIQLHNIEGKKDNLFVELTEDDYYGLYFEHVED